MIVLLVDYVAESREASSQQQLWKEIVPKAHNGQVLFRENGVNFPYEDLDSIYEHGLNFTLILKQIFYRTCKCSMHPKCRDTSE